MPVWTPRVTVAAIVNRQNHFLMVREKAAGKIVYNQPAGHLEDNESLVEAIKREMMEETGLVFHPTALVGIYRWPQPARQRAYLRFAFTGDVATTQPAPRDADILEALWMDKTGIEALEVGQLRSPLVMTGIEDYLNNMRYNLGILREFSWKT